MNKLLKILFYLLLINIFLINISHALPGYSDRFDQHLRKNSKVYFGISFDWQWFKAQAVAESNLDPEAVSWCDAKGIMQIMPATWGEIKRQLPFLGSIKNPKWNIAAGIYYNRKMYNIWTAPRPEKDRIAFMLGSYNAGAGNILKAQRAACGTNFWCELIKFADQVSTWNSKETIGYVAKIFKIMGETLCDQ